MCVDQRWLLFWSGYGFEGLRLASWQADGFQMDWWRLPTDQNPGEMLRRGARGGIPTNPHSQGVHHTQRTCRFRPR